MSAELDIDYLEGDSKCILRYMRIRKMSEKASDTDSENETQRRIRLAEEVYKFCSENQFDICFNDSLWYREEGILIGANYLDVPSRIVSQFVYTKMAAIDHMKANATPSTCYVIFGSPISPGGTWLDGGETIEDDISRATNLGFAAVHGEGSMMYKQNRKSNKVAKRSDVVYVRKLYIMRDKSGEIADRTSWKKATAIIVPRIDYASYVKKYGLMAYIRAMAQRVDFAIKIPLLNKIANLVVCPEGLSESVAIASMFKNDPAINKFGKVIFLSTNADTVKAMENIIGIC